MFMVIPLSVLRANDTLTVNSDVASGGGVHTINKAEKDREQVLGSTRFIVTIHMKKIHQLHIFIRLRQKKEANKLFRTH